MRIANVHNHVERAIKRIKTWPIFNQVLPLPTYGSINKIWIVCSLLLNFQNPNISVIEKHFRPKLTLPYTVNTHM